MEVYPVKSYLVAPNSRLAPVIIAALSSAKLRPHNGDVIVVTSKVVAISEGRLAMLPVKFSSLSRRLASKYLMDEGFAQIVLDEADKRYRGVQGAILTLKDGDAVANSGADQKNAPPGTVVLWPKNPDTSARRLRRELEQHYRKRLGVIIADSRVTPLRLGTVGLALAAAGFDPIRDVRGRPDLYDRKTRITVVAVADGIADAAHLVMGEAGESVPFALIRNPPVAVDGSNRPKRRMLISAENCLYMSNLTAGGR